MLNWYRKTADCGLDDPEFEMLDTRIFAEDQFSDVQIEYAKAIESDILIKISITNRGSGAADIHVLPTLWFRNTWSWGYSAGPMDQDLSRRLISIFLPNEDGRRPLHSHQEKFQKDSPWGNYCSSTNISTVTQEKVWGQAIKPVGPD